MGIEYIYSKETQVSMDLLIKDYDNYCRDFINSLNKSLTDSDKLKLLMQDEIRTKKLKRITDFLNKTFPESILINEGE